jgi:hypothetical protein
VPARVGSKVWRQLTWGNNFRDTPTEIALRNKDYAKNRASGRGRERRLLSQAGPTYHQGPNDNTGRGPQDSGMEGGAANAAWLFTSVTTTRSDHQLRLRRCLEGNCFLLW